MSKKKALLIGLNYTHVQKETELCGCVNDVHNMQRFLNTHGFMDITMLTDEFIEDQNLVTWTGILTALTELVISSWKEELDIVVFHYAGHGRQARDQDGDERDGLDEGIVPVDYKVHGIIPDDVLNRLVRQFNPKTKVLCIFDCCHSGSILDLEHTWDEFTNYNSDVVRDVVPFVVCLSAARDPDIAGEVHKERDTGAFTTYLLEQLDEDEGLHQGILSVQKNVNDRLQRGGYDQRHVVSSSKMIHDDMSFCAFLNTH